jgi:glycosyltransferase involved in cell wall biosynthesis
MFLIFTTLVLFIALLGYYHWYIQVAAPLLTINKKAVIVNDATTDVTVVVCAKNEAEDIGKLIDCLKEQTYTNFKVFILDDNSSDDTYQVAKDAVADDDRFSILQLNESQKKYRAKKGVVDFAYQQIDSSWILHIDADCLPSSQNWIAGMMQKTTDQQIQLVLGLGFFQPAKLWWQHILQGETILIAMQYIGTALYGKPYMAVGRNLAVYKSIYKQVEFDEKLLSGDDDLLIQQFANEQNTAVQIAEEARTLSNYPKNFKDYLRMKIRHVSTAAVYKKNDQIKLTLWPLGLACAWLGLSLDSQYFTMVYAVLLFLRVLFQAKISRVIYGRTFLAFLLIVESYLLFQSLIVYITHWIRPITKWN